MTKMINNILSFPQVPDVSQIKPAPDMPAEIPASNGSETTKREAGSNLSSQDQTPAYLLRLTVDKDPDTGEWVYKAIDRYTGEVVRVLPRQELVKMRESSNYKAGSVIKTDV